MHTGGRFGEKVRGVDEAPYACAPLPICELPPSKREIVGPGERPAIVAREPDDGILVQPKLLEGRGQIPNRLIQSGDHPLKCHETDSIIKSCLIIKRALIKVV